jgi:hypothetical protein
LTQLIYNTKGLWMVMIQMENNYSNGTSNPMMTLWLKYG